MHRLVYLMATINFHRMHARPDITVMVDWALKKHTSSFDRLHAHVSVVTSEHFLHRLCAHTRVVGGERFF